MVKHRIWDREVPVSIPANIKCRFLEQETLSTLLSTGFYPGKQRATWKISISLLNVLPSINKVDYYYYYYSTTLVGAYTVCPDTVNSIRILYMTKFDTMIIILHAFWIFVRITLVRQRRFWKHPKHVLWGITNKTRPFLLSFSSLKILYNSKIIFFFCKHLRKMRLLQRICCS